MFNQLVAALIPLGLLAFLFQKNRMQRTWAALLFVAFFSVVAFSIASFGFESYPKPFIWKWIVSPVINVNLVLKYSPDLDGVAAALFLAVGVALFYNSFCFFEKERLKVAGLAIFLLVMMIVLISAQNMMQLLVAACFIDVLAFYLINDMPAKQKFVFFNLLADMLLMTALALFWIKSSSLNFNALPLFAKNNPYASIVAAFLILAAMMKSGLFLFHDAFLNLKNLSFQRNMLLITSATPLAGAFILYKFMPLMVALKWTEPLIFFAALFTILWALVGTLIVNNMHVRILYFNMCVYGLLFACLAAQYKTFLTFLPAALMCSLVTTIILILPVIAASNDALISHYGAFFKQMKFTAGLSLIALCLEIPVWYHFVTLNLNFFIVAALALRLIVLAHILGRIYLGKKVADDKVWSLLRNPHLFYLIPLILLSAALLIFNTDAFSYYAAAFTVLICLVFISRPFRFLNPCLSNSFIQNAQPVMKFYYFLLVLPLTVMGRVLWILIDFLLIERTLLYALQRIVSLLVCCSQNIHAQLKIGGVAFVLCGIAVLLLSFFAKEW